MTTSATNSVKAFALITLGLALAAMGFYIANADDAPGAAGLGFLLMAGAVTIGVKAARNRVPAWGYRAALGVGLVVAAFAAFLTHSIAVGQPLFAASPQVPSVSATEPSLQYAAAVARAREAVHLAIVEQNLPGVSVAVGAGGALIWAEGFGWRDVVTETAVTPATRFVIGTAFPAVAAAAVRLQLADTGAEPAVAWSPEQHGEEGEDFPPFALIRHTILQPLGIAPPEYPIPGERATFYVPRDEDHDTRRGRRLMYMRDLACCDGIAFYSTPTDLVRFAVATNADSVNGELAGGAVMSLLTRRDAGLAVAVTSNIAYADTATIAQRVADLFMPVK